MRIVIPGGSGQLGRVLERELTRRGHDVVVIGRSVPEPHLRWDGRTDGEWMKALDGADAVVNLAGRSVNCRYHWANLNEMMQSRVDSTLAVGRAIAAAEDPPPVWLQASTASIYAHTLGEPNDETGELGGREPDVPDYWAYSVAIGRAWELALASSETPRTRKVAMRTGFTMSPDAGGVFDWLHWMVDVGLGGSFCEGSQFVSWITGRDLARAVEFLIERDDLEGPVNLTTPNPLPNSEFMAVLRDRIDPAFAVAVTPLMARVGAVLLKTDVELMRKSRRVVPRRLLEAGFEFQDAHWRDAVPRLVSKRAA